ncbi:MAG TPA: tetratricopeptide repeat protein [Longimicrobium sp.]|nr:tetratricopeptide repeat protein [Longimicrobium sp.]
MRAAPAAAEAHLTSHSRIIMSNAGMNATRDEHRRLFEVALTAAEEGRLDEAAETLQQALMLDPNSPSAWWNLGTFRAKLGQFEAALSAWDFYHGLVPHDWHGLSAIIEASNAIGDTARRDHARAQLRSLWQAGADPALAAQSQYRIEQRQMGDMRLIAYETFAPEGERRVFYVFPVVQPDGAVVGQYSLGSFDTVTGVQRDLGHIGPDDRLYHLDWDSADLHLTFAFYSALPSYDETRDTVIAALMGEISAVSGAVRPEPGGAPHIMIATQDEQASMGERAGPRTAAMAAAMAALAYGPPAALGGQKDELASPSRVGGAAASPAAPPPPPAPASSPLGARMASWGARLLGRRGNRPN